MQRRHLAILIYGIHYLIRVVTIEIVVDFLKVSRLNVLEKVWVLRGLLEEPLQRKWTTFDAVNASRQVIE